MTRQSKTPRQRAEEALGIAERRITRLSAKRTAAAEALEEVDAELDDARVRLAYVKDDPALAGLPDEPDTPLDAGTTPTPTT